MKINTFDSEHAIITAIRSRSVTGAEMLYDVYAINLHKVILSIVKDPELAFIVLEKTFFEIWNNCDEFDQQEKRFGIWIMGLARKTAKGAVYKLETTPDFFNTDLFLTHAEGLNGLSLG